MLLKMNCVRKLLLLGLITIALPVLAVAASPRGPMVRLVEIASKNRVAGKDWLRRKQLNSADRHTREYIKEALERTRLFKKNDIYNAVFGGGTRVSAATQRQMVSALARDGSFRAMYGLAGVKSDELFLEFSESISDIFARAFVEALESMNPKVRGEAILKAYDQCKEVEAIDLALKKVAIEDSDYQNRVWAVRVLGRRNNLKDLKIFLEHLYRNEKDLDVRDAAHMALRDLSR